LAENTELFYVKFSSTDYNHKPVLLLFTVHELVKEDEFILEFKTINSFLDYKNNFDGISLQISCIKDSENLTT
jgi:DNA-dependent RNA polymerase auxiliary subunit epsilon